MGDVTGSAGSTFHRYGRDDELVSEAEWHDAAAVRRRVSLALGPQPLEDNRYLLAPLILSPAPPHAPPGPQPATEFIIDLKPLVPFSGGNNASYILSEDVRPQLGMVRLWGQLKDSSRWVLMEEMPGSTVYREGALCWELSSLFVIGRQAEYVLDGYVNLISRYVSGLSPELRETTKEAGVRATRFAAIRNLYGRSLEMRLLPQGHPFPTREIWRAAYSLGFTWGHLDLFHWHDSLGARRLFSLSSVGHPGYFLPEHVSQGGANTGIALGFELPFAPAPVETYDRMAVALAHFRQKLGGRPMTADGAELDADRLYADRDTLEAAIATMNEAGISPGSPEAARIF